MSTEIKDRDGAGLSLLRLANGTVYVRTDSDGVEPTLADFLAAVAAECDVIVIPRAELPPVEEVNGEIYSGDRVVMGDGLTLAEADRAVREWVAIREHVAARPPIDEAQVEALAAEIVQAQSPGYPDATDLARRLVERGVRVDGAR